MTEREVESRSLEWRTKQRKGIFAVQSVGGTFTINHSYTGGETHMLIQATSWGKTEREHMSLAQRLADVLDGVPGQARAEQPSSDLCPDCGQSLRGAGE